MSYMKETYLHLIDKMCPHSFVRQDGISWPTFLFRSVSMTMLLALSLSLGNLAFGYEPIPPATLFYNRSGVAIPSDSLRFGNGGWSRGRDQGFAFALQKNTNYFYLWIQATGGTPLG